MNVVLEINKLFALFLGPPLEDSFYFMGVKGVTFSGIKVGRFFRPSVLCANYVSYVYSMMLFAIVALFGLVLIKYVSCCYCFLPLVLGRKWTGQVPTEQPAIVQEGYSLGGTQSWIQEAKNIFRATAYTYAKRVTFGTFMLVDEAEHWWENIC